MHGDSGWVGPLHTALGFLCLALGTAVVSVRKGTRQHRRLGLSYAAAMLGLNATALSIYRVFGGFGPFHVLALISLATLCAGILPALRRRPGWLERHARLMSWSYVGLLAATAAEAATRLPVVRSGTAFGVAALLSSLAVVAVGAAVIYRRVPRIVASQQR
jgi:uncharacterized membrane protein